MWRRLYESLFVRLFASFVMVVAAAFGLEAWLVIRTGRSAIRSLVEDNLDALARTTQSGILGYLQERGREVASWSRLGVMDDILVHDRILSIENLLLELRRSAPDDYASLTVTDQSGEVVAATNMRQVGQRIDVERLAPRPLADRGMRSGDFGRMDEPERRTFVLAHEITSLLRSEPIGWLIADIDWNVIQRMIRDLENAHGENQEKVILLLDGTGAILAGEPERLGDGARQSGQAVPIAGDLLRSPHLLHATSASTPWSAGGLPLQVAVFWRQERALALLRIFMLTVGAASGIGLLLSAGASALGTKDLTRRLGKLAEGTARVARGHLEFRVEEGNIQEFGQLARSFNSMAEELGRAQAGLEAAVARWSSLVTNAPDFILTMGRSGEMLFTNRTVPGLDMKQVLGRPIYDFVAEAYWGALRQTLNGVLDTGKPASLDLEGVGPEGSLSWYSTRLGPLLQHDMVVGAIMIATDITERKRLEREIVEVSEIERKRMGRDLHDGLGQVLTGISLMSRRLQSSLEEHFPEEAGEAGRIEALATDAIETAKRLSRGLVPVSLEHGGLAGALADLAAMVCSAKGIACRITGTLAPPVMDQVKATHLLRIAQEAVNNALRHGKARTIEIRLSSLDGTSSLTIWNDGLPFRIPPQDCEGIGLRSMRYRADFIGATLSIGPCPDGGTMVRCTFS